MATMTSFVEERSARRSARREQLSTALDQVVARLKALGAIRVVVFGSYVDGRLRRWSDLEEFVNALDDVTHEYNNTPHQGIGYLTPAAYQFQGMICQA